MPLETGTFLSDLVASNPVGSDNKSTADDHLRLIKSTLRASFPSVAGAVTKSHMELNAAHDQRVPVGGIIMWSGALAAIPTGWLLCNGLSGTPNLLDRFVIGAGSSYAVGALGGSKDAVIPSHSHTATTGTESVPHTHSVIDPGHTHAITGSALNSFGFVGGGGNAYANTGTTTSAVATTGISLASESAQHNHAVTVAAFGVSAISANLPPYYALCFIMKAA